MPRNRHYTRTELYLGLAVLEVEITFDAYPGEPMVMYYPNGDGYPGSDPYAELITAKVVSWEPNWAIRERDDDHWIWPLLDRIAFAHIEDHWSDRFQSLCLDDVPER